MIKKIFISKSIDEVQSLIDFCKKNEFELTAHSFLQFEAIPFQVEESYEAIFFGSPRAVDFFLSQETIPTSTIIGCIGEITAQSLKSHRIDSHFIGKTSGDTAGIAIEFKKFIGDKKVLFPQSSISNRSVSSIFDSTQITEISIYKTAIHSLLLEKSDIYVFTSPSNVDGFLIENKIPFNGKVIAWGKTTEKYLIEKDIKVDNTLKNSSIVELISLLNEKN